MKEETLLRDKFQTRLEAIGDQLRGKVSSKFQTSTFLAGFAFTVMGIQISLLWQSDQTPQLLPLSISLMLVSVFLYIGAIVKLDGLTMPKRFWKEDKADRNPESSRLAYLTEEELWEIKNRMVFYWTTLTLVATGVTVVSLLLLLVPSIPITLFESIGGKINLVQTTFMFTGLSMFLMLVYIYVLYLRANKTFKPLLRPSD